MLSGGGGGGGGGGSGGTGGASNFGIDANASYSGALSTAMRVTTAHTNTVTIGNGKVIKYMITDASQNYPVDTSAKLNFGITLNDNIKQNILDYYFTPSGPNEGRPTQAAIDLFTQIWASNTYPMDKFHKNKLRDLVYYVMEYIIPGLPTKALPISYVEWRPVQWLSHSDI